MIHGVEDIMKKKQISFIVVVKCWQCNCENRISLGDHTNPSFYNKKEYLTCTQCDMLLPVRIDIIA